MKPFKFKQFEIIQKQNPQKVGTDSMLLGAWTSQIVDRPVSRILDIGTGTGILALMMAQSFLQANITAIEPMKEAELEANLNFKSSPFSNRILSIYTKLQDFGAMEKFDLIICNPPYYDGTFKSENVNRNQARHNDHLPPHELYECVAELLSPNGWFNLILPYSVITEHIERAFDNALFLQNILHTIKEDGERKRSILSFGFNEVDPTENELIVKYKDGSYSQAYIKLTEAFYRKDLRSALS